MGKLRTLTQSLQKPDLSEAEIAFVAGETRQPVEINQNSDSVKIPQSVAEKPETSPKAEGTVSLSVRLPGGLAAKLLETSFFRKLNRQKPCTQQDIVAEALADWLKKFGKTI